MTNKKNDRQFDGRKDAGASVGAEQGAATRRNFLFSLLGGLAGAVGLSALVARKKAFASAAAGAKPIPDQPAAKPIDNIFTPIPSRKDLKRRGL